MPALAVNPVRVIADSSSLRIVAKRVVLLGMAIGRAELS